MVPSATAVLMMSEEKALALGYKPKSYVRGYTYVGVDLFDELLLGPAFATEKVLRQLNLTLADMGVIEFHEAFAGQVLANITTMASEKFGKERFPGGKALGQIDFSIMNNLGDSLSIGHPSHPSATPDARLVTTASNRLQRENKRFALLTACADGGLGMHACYNIERYDNK